MSPEEAARLIDGVKEGSPRVSTGGRRQSGKDW
jgi:hypothetical protein